MRPSLWGHKTPGSLSQGSNRPGFLPPGSVYRRVVPWGDVSSSVKELHEPTCRNFLTETASFRFAHDVSRGRCKLETLGSAIDEECDLRGVRAAFQFSSHDVRQERKVFGKYIHVRVRDA